MTKEDKYREEMIALGTWHTAFAPMVHDLAILERELSRTRAAWKRTAPPGQAPSPLDPHYQLIRQQFSILFRHNKHFHIRSLFDSF